MIKNHQGYHVNPDRKWTCTLLNIDFFIILKSKSLVVLPFFTRPKSKSYKAKIQILFSRLIKSISYKDRMWILELQKNQCLIGYRPIYRLDAHTVIEIPCPLYSNQNDGRNTC